MSDNQGRRSALHDKHAAAGATFTDFAGWQMPLRYSSDLNEHHAVRRAAGLFDLSHMGEIEITGPEAVKLVNRAVVSDISGLADGQAKYTMICREDGGILDDLIVYRLGAERFFIVANASNTDTAVAAFRAVQDGFDAEVADTRDDWALIAIQGPTARQILRGLTDVDLDALKYYRIATGVAAGVEALVARTGYTGEDGFELYVRAADGPAVWDALLTAGADDGLVPCGLSCRDSLRLEAGMPLYGHELDVELTPYEAELGRLVALDKEGGFVGQDALQERSGHEVTKKRVGLRPEGRRAPRGGYPVLDADGTQVGTVTSGAPSPTLGHPIAMAFVDTAHSAPGTALQVDVRGTKVPAAVVPLPFYKRPR